MSVSIRHTSLTKQLQEIFLIAPLCISGHTLSPGAAGAALQHPAVLAETVLHRVKRELPGWVVAFLLFCIPALLLNRRREMTWRCGIMHKKKENKLGFCPLQCQQAVLWFCPFPLSVLPAGWFSCLPITLSFALDVAGELNTRSHDDSRHARGCLVQRGLAGGAAPARPAAMHRASSLLHHVPGTPEAQGGL